MKITYKGDYALKAVLDLAVHYREKPVTTQKIAKRIDAPVKFLEQVLLELKKGGFIESRRGNIGGYLLAKAPGQITLGAIVRYIDGPIEPISCVKDQYANCADRQKCVFKKIWQNVSLAISGVIDRITFEDLVLEVKKRQKTLVYSI